VYIEKMIKSFQRLLGDKPSHNICSPLKKGVHPDMADFLDSAGIQIYQLLIGAMQWAVSLARFDITNAMMAISSFRVAPRVGHFGCYRHIYGCLSQFKDASLKIRTDESVYDSISDQEYDWMYTVYGNVEESLPTDAFTSLGKLFKLTHGVDANLFRDMVTGRSVTGILEFVNQTPFHWYSRKQANIETTTYGCEFATAHTCAESDINLRTLLRFFGVPIYEETFIFGENDLVVNSSMTPHAKLHKRHNALSFHRVREAISAKIIGFYHIASESNVADILSKNWGYNQVWPLLQCVLFWRGDTIDYRSGQGGQLMDCMFLFLRVYTSHIVSAWNSLLQDHGECQILYESGVTSMTYARVIF
jgi:hypothetical protein